MPSRYYDVGIAEEHAVLFACGMATMGFHPVCAIYSTFLQRAYDCIVHDAALQDLPVIFCMDRAGLSAQDGPTHHGLFDISYVRSVPNCIAMAPKDEDELVDMMFTATHERHPTFIRYPRGPAEGVPIKEQPRLIEIGKAEVIQNFANNGGRKVALFPLGNMMPLGRKAAAQLAAEGYDVALVNPRFVKPLDAGVTEFFGRAADVIVTLEDHVLMGGYGSAVLELLQREADHHARHTNRLAGSVHRARHDGRGIAEQVWPHGGEHGRQSARRIRQCRGRPPERRGPAPVTGLWPALRIGSIARGPAAHSSGISGLELLPACRYLYTCNR